MKTFICKICAQPIESSEFMVREMMFGYRDVFIYVQCPNCDCLQLRDLPENISKYYPTNYYSYKENKIIGNSTLRYRILVRKARLDAIKGKQNVVNRALLAILKDRGIPIWLIRLYPYLNVKSSILDIGSGTGETLVKLWYMGFQNLTGSDLYIPSTIIFGNKFSIRKENVSEINGNFDVIMLHHSLEHMEDQKKIFFHLSTMMSENTLLVIRIPTVDSYAWEHYRENWVQLDAPRHQFIHSKKSIQLLLEVNNLQIVDIFYDSTGFQFFGSEQYKMDIPLMDSRSLQVNKKSRIFTKKGLKLFDQLANELNRNNQGDQFCLFIRKKKYEN